MNPLVNCMKHQTDLNATDESCSARDCIVVVTYGACQQTLDDGGPTESAYFETLACDAWWRWQRNSQENSRRLLYLLEDIPLNPQRHGLGGKGPCLLRSAFDSLVSSVRIGQAHCAALGRLMPSEGGAVLRQRGMRALTRGGASRPLPATPSRHR